MDLNLLVDADLRTFQNTFLENSFRLPYRLALFDFLENRENLSWIEWVDEADSATIEFLENSFDKFNHDLIFIDTFLFCFHILHKLVF